MWGEKSTDIEYSSSILRWEDMIEMGKDYIDLPIFERQKNMAINQCCVLIYTSGTTGNPKGTWIKQILTHCYNIRPVNVNNKNIDRFFHEKYMQV